ncbi:MAG TPA: alpha/beta hydrolase [Actinophytocola sp.]|uniref:alpha/beta hydrolase n=1 Tax=Actinophytocola sp. TaxID=1872138 RepID=UPI002F937055
MIKDMPNVWDDIGAMTAAKARALQAEALADLDVAPPPGVATEDLTIPGAAGPLRGRVYRPATGPVDGVVLWLHGGGFVLGSIDTEQSHGPLALASRCAVVSVDYRSAPEAGFPAAVWDTYATLCWVGENAKELSGHANRVVLGGESAGGNLAAVAALLARDEGGPEVALQVLLYPMTARTFDGPSRHDPAVSPLWPPAAIEWVWRQYLGDDDGSSPLASPLYADSLAGLPPALVLTAEYDLLRDEGEAYADRLAAEGVPVRRRRYAGMPHGFVEWTGVLAGADECIHDMGRSIRAAISVDDPEPVGIASAEG